MDELSTTFSEIEEITAGLLDRGKINQNRGEPFNCFRGRAERNYPLCTCDLSIQVVIPGAGGC